MRNESDSQEDSHLQHEAEHERPAKKRSVMSYLTILFGAAFLLMLLSYFMQQRTSDEALGTQQNITVTAMKSIEELREDNETPIKQVDELQGQLEATASKVGQLETAIQSAQAERDQLQAQSSALNHLNRIRALYNQQKSADAKAALAEAEQAMAANGGMQEVLGWVSARLTETDRDIYDPLEAYRSLLDWLS